MILFLLNLGVRIVHEDAGALPSELCSALLHSLQEADGMSVRVAAVALHRPEGIPVDLVLRVLVPYALPLTSLLSFLLLEPVKFNFLRHKGNRFILALSVKGPQKALNKLVSDIFWSGPFKEGSLDYRCNRLGDPEADFASREDMSDHYVCQLQPPQHLHVFLRLCLRQFFQVLPEELQHLHHFLICCQL